MDAQKLIPDHLVTSLRFWEEGREYYIRLGEVLKTDAFLGFVANCDQQIVRLTNFTIVPRSIHASSNYRDAA